MITLARLPLLLFAAALGGAWWRSLPPPAPAFVVPPPVASSLPASFSTSPLTDAATAAYRPSLARLSDGRMAAAWLQTNPEQTVQATVRLAFWDGRQWSPPRIIVDRRLLAMAGKAQVQTLDAPMLFAHGGRLHLWLIAGSAWGTSTLYHLTSADHGENWTSPERLPTSPLLNLGSHDPMPPLALTDGGIGVPLSHTLFSRHGEWLRFDNRGQLVDKARVSHAVSALAPHVVALDGQRSFALLRDAAPGAGLHSATSRDGGARWQVSEASAPDTATAPKALLRLASGNLLLAAHASDGMSLWVSADEGRLWRRARSLKVASPAELALAQDNEGWIHLLTGAQGLQHLRFSEAWLQESAR